MTTQTGFAPTDGTLAESNGATREAGTKREYSVEAARHPERTTDMHAPAGAVKGKRPSALQRRTIAVRLCSGTLGLV
jgi:hypothetical protein